MTRQDFRFRSMSLIIIVITEATCKAKQLPSVTQYQHPTVSPRSSKILHAHVRLYSARTDPKWNFNLPTGGPSSLATQAPAHPPASYIIRRHISRAPPIATVRHGALFEELCGKRLGKTSSSVWFLGGCSIKGWGKNGNVGGSTSQ